ncbi:hypothetical protein [Streptomyces sp. 769]|nr:hypothetical protein [Streptomyces sp. 769]
MPFLRVVRAPRAVAAPGIVTVGALDHSASLRGVEPLSGHRRAQ